jgi:hypothetical protein
MIDLYEKLSTYLHSTGNKPCILKAKEFESYQGLDRNLHFRDLNLNSSDVLEIVRIITKSNIDNNIKIESLSFSYNNIMDEGIKYLLRYIPSSVSEIGLVNCGITDQGAKEIVNWLTNSNNSIKMLCVEQNEISESLKTKFHEITQTKPYLSIYI